MAATALVDFQFTMITIQCHTCGTPYGMPDYFQRMRKEDHQTFHCLNGHRAWYPDKNQVEELQQKLQDAHSETQKANRAKLMAESTARMESEQRQKAEKKLDRINKGVCTQCHRSFTNIARHMQSKHGVKCNQPPKGSKVRGG